MRVLVTGGASGLGAALVARWAARGDQVLSVDLSAPPGTDRPDRPLDPSVDVGADGSVVRGVLDVTSDDDWESARAWVAGEWGGLDVLVNNAGVAGGGRIERCSLDEWRRLFEVNLFGVVRGTRTFTPMLKAQGSGRIVNTASLAGLVHPPGMGSYNAAKAAVVAFSETTAHELAPYGVGCSAVCPSYFRTNLMSSMRGDDAGVSEIVTQLVERSPISADDIAAAVVAGVEAGEELIVPDEPARAAYALKSRDPTAYTAQMRHLADGLKEQA